jgi:hypothetical protein
MRHDPEVKVLEEAEWSDFHAFSRTRARIGVQIPPRPALAASRKGRRLDAGGGDDVGAPGREASIPALLSR